jgi:hypothetical protein
MAGEGSSEERGLRPLSKFNPLSNKSTFEHQKTKPFERGPGGELEKATKTK